MKEKALHTFDIGVIAGDGVGPEVIAEGSKPSKQYPRKTRL